MHRSIIGTLLLLLIICACVSSEPIFKSSTKVGEVPLIMNGRGVREVSAFGVDVYRAALYLEKVSSDERAILTSDSKKKLAMIYLRDIDGADIVKAWDKSLTENCLPPLKRCGEMGAARKVFLSLLEDASSQERWDFEFSKEGVRILRENSELAVIEDEDFSRLLLATWIGPKPPTEDLKRSLLGRK